MEIIIDADACPKDVLKTCERLAQIAGVSLCTVANYRQQIESSQHYEVDDGPEAADLKIVNYVHPGDIVVTQDYGLASLVLAKGGKALSPNGHIFKAESVELMLETRAAEARLRRRKEFRHGFRPKKRTSNDRALFYKSLAHLLAINNLPHN